MAEPENGLTGDESEGPLPEGGPVEAGDSAETAELRKRCEELELAAAQLKDQLLRKAAEFDNFRKRTDAESASVVRFANEDLLLKILPVVDDLERAFKALGAGAAPAATVGAPTGETGTPAPDSGAATADARREASFISGVELIYGKLRKALEQAGLRPFESVGKPFDPELHDALLQVPREDLPHHTVVEEIDRGYQLHDRVIRHARVIVSSNPGTAEG